MERMKIPWRKEPPTVEEVDAGQDYWWHRGPTGECAVYVFETRENVHPLWVHVGYDFDPFRPNAESWGGEGARWAPCVAPPYEE